MSALPAIIEVAAKADWGDWLIASRAGVQNRKTAAYVSMEEIERVVINAVLASSAKHDTAQAVIDRVKERLEELVA